MSSKLLERKFLFWGCKIDVNQITCNLSLFSCSASFSYYLNAYCLQIFIYGENGQDGYSTIWIKIKNQNFSI